MSDRIVITINGRRVSARRGDTVLAVLTTAGYRHLGYSRQGEPRGALCGMGVCYGCRVTINGTPGCRACMTPVADEMEIQTDGNR